MTITRTPATAALRPYQRRGCWDSIDAVPAGMTRDDAADRLRRSIRLALQFDFIGIPLRGFLPHHDA
jgi:hypothetical protein